MRLLLLLSLSLMALHAATGFISAETLNTLLDKKNLVIVDVTDEKVYLNEHIPHAHLTKISSWRRPVKKHQLMRSSREIEKEMQALGINNNSQVVIYGHGKGKDNLKVSYIALAMIVNGLKDVAILNGGFAEWEDDDDREISNRYVFKEVGTFKANFNPNILVDLEYVKAHISKVPMLEARPPAFYYGTLRSSGVARIGHIPHAMSSFWKDKFKIDGTLQDEDIIKEIVFDGYNLKADQEVILYCTGGLEASMNWFLLSQHLHFSHAKIYDASMREWGNRQDTPMTRYKWETFGY